MQTLRISTLLLLGLALGAAARLQGQVTPSGNAKKDFADAVAIKKLEEVAGQDQADLAAEKADSSTLAAAAEQEAKGKNTTALAATVLETTGRCGPQTKIHLPLTQGSGSWSDPFAANKKHPIGRYDVKQAKICGPGTFTFSPTSCGRMDYKPDIFEISPKDVSSGCSVVDLKWCSVGGLGCMMVDC